MEDLSPEPPAPADRPHPAIDPHAAWIDGVLEADLGAPRKQRHTAKRIYDRLVEERRYEGSYSAVQRHVREWRIARAACAGGGYLELEWAPGTAQGDYGNFEAVVAGERLRLKLLVVGSLAELNDLLRDGCDRLNAASRARDGRPAPEVLAEDLAAMLALPSSPFDAVRWARCRADKRGVVTVDGRGHLAGPAWHSRELLCGVRADTVEILADRGRRVAVLKRAFGDGPIVRNPLSLVPALVARPRAFGESVIRRDMPEGLVRAIDSLDAAGRRRVLRSMIPLP